MSARQAFMKLAAKKTRDEKEWIEGYMAIRPYTAMETVLAELIAIDDDHAIMEFEICDAARQPMGLLHGGVSMMIGESVASLHAAWLCDLAKAAPVGLDINGTHLRSATEGRVRATAKVLRLTRSFVFHEIEVEHIDSGDLLCKIRISNYFRPHS